MIRGDFVRSRRLTCGVDAMCVFMSMRLPACGSGGYPATPWSDPQRYSRLCASPANALRGSGGCKATRCRVLGRPGSSRYRGSLRPCIACFSLARTTAAFTGEARMAEKLIAENRRARFDYDLLERVEAGIVLTGTEVKSLRGGRTTMAQAFADIRDGEAWLNGLEISIYDQGGRANHEPVRPRKLLLHRRATDSPSGKILEKHLTIVPTKTYFKDSRVKLRLPVAMST